MGQIFVGGPGNHTFIGSPGTNTLDYSAAPAPTNVDLAGDTAQNGFGGTDIVGNIQVVKGGAFGGIFTGGSGAETFVVGGGNNTITGTSPTITEFPLLPTSNAQPFAIITGPDGNIWFSEFNTDKIGRLGLDGTLVEFSTPHPVNPASGNTGGLAFDAAGNVWFAEIANDKIGVMSPTGVLLHEFAIPTTGALPHMITAGPDGNFWFAETGTDKIGRITLDGTVTEFAIPTSNSQTFDIIVGPDGALWFTEFTAGKIGRITTDGVITEFNVPVHIPTNQGAVHIGDPVSLAVGPDGALWYSDLDGNGINRITTDGFVTEFAIPTAASQPQGLVVGPDGAIWFAEQVAGKIGRMTTDGRFTEFTIPSAGGAGPFPFGITVGADGHLWFSELLGHRIGRITAGSVLTVDYSNAPSAVTVNLEAGSVQNGFGGTDTLTDVQAIIGGAGDDTFVSGGSQDAIGDSVSLAGGDGADNFAFTANAFPRAQSGLFNRLADYTFAEGDQIGISALVSDAFAHGGGQPITSLVRVVEAASGTFARLQVDRDGAANGVNFTTIARLDGLHLNDPVVVVLDATQPAGTSIAVAGRTSRNDFDGDGTSDILWRSTDGQVTTSLLAGAQLKSADILPRATTEWHIVSAGDFNGDGTSDLLWRNDGGQNFVELLNNGRFQSGVQLPSATSEWHVAGCGDFNGDGTSDLLWRNDAGQNFVELLNNGHFQSGVQLPSATSEWHVVGIGDFNGDGTSDILWHNDGGSNFIELLNNGHFQSGTQLPATTIDWHVAGIGDFNGDGTSDILWHNDNGQNFVELLSNGQFQSGVQLPATTSEWHAADTGDYDGDGTTDILWRNDSGQDFIELLINGQFQLGVELPTVANNWHVVGHLGELV